MPKSDLKKLQDEWYEKLSESGFKDIEAVVGGHSLLKKRAYRCYGTQDLLFIELKIQYYRQIGLIANDQFTIFRDEIDRFILIRHSEGARAKDIVEDLKIIGKTKARNTIRFIIRRYEMAWGLKFYNKNLLNVYRKK